MLSGYKTYIAGTMVVLGAIAAYLTGDSTLQQALSIAIPAILAMTVRHGITTTVNNQ